MNNIPTLKCFATVFPKLKICVYFNIFSLRIGILTLGVTWIDKIYSIFDGFYEACQGQTIIVGYYRRFYILC